MGRHTDDKDVGQGAASRAYEFERSIGNLIEAAGLKRFDVKGSRFDWAVIDRDGRRTAIETKLSVRTTPNVLVEQWLQRASDFDRLLLVTLEGPDPKRQSQLRAIAERSNVDFEWMSATQFQEWLGEPPKDLSSVATQTALARAAIVASLPKHARSPAPALLALRDQLPPAMLEQAARERDLRSYLRIGERLPARTVLLSDLANYSTLVGKAPPEDISAAMGRYYRLAREAVFGHGGTLAKFVGDSVLAIFDYPDQQPDAASRAVLCASDLIAIGRAVLEEIIDAISIDVETGTRVGLANGEVVVVDAGRELPLGEFVSDPINRAARLQKHSPLDGALVDRRTLVALRAEDEVFLRSLQLTQLPDSIPAEEAKGQFGPVPAWVISAEIMAQVHKTHPHL